MWPLRCLQFLDGAFARNPYPGAAERAQLVIECNNLLGKILFISVPLYQINWFSK